MRRSRVRQPDPDGHGPLAAETRYEYDAADNLVRVEGPDPDGPGPQPGLVTEYRPVQK